MTWLADVGPDHFGLSVRGQILSWSGMDSQERYQKHQQDSSSRKRIENLGFNETNVIYSYNNQGFRSPEFEMGTNIMALGGSMTEGVGVNTTDTWCNRLQELCGIRVWNMGIGACAMDTCFRILDHYLPILKPQAIVMIKPPPARFELLASYGSFDVYGPHMTTTRNDSYIKEWLVSDENASINDRKNSLAMTKLCDDASVPIHMFEPEDIEIDGCARDLAHPGVAAHDKFARRVYAKMKEQK